MKVHNVHEECIYTTVDEMSMAKKWQHTSIVHVLGKEMHDEINNEIWLQQQQRERS